MSPYMEGYRAYPYITKSPYGIDSQSDQIWWIGWYDAQRVFFDIHVGTEICY